MKARLSKFIGFLSTLGLAVWATGPRAAAQTPLALTIHLNAGEVQLTVAGAAGTACQVQWTEQLSSASGWFHLGHCVFGASPSSLTDSVSSATRYYRAVWTPNTNLVWISSGAFTMGDTMGDGSLYELPTHTVYVSAFYMDRTAVTKALWDAVYLWAVGHGYSFDRPGSGKATNHPVQDINWYDCVKWCNARSEEEGWVPAYYTRAGQTSVYRTGHVNVQNDWVKWNAGYRLPTEAEWEKAARGGLSGKRFPWGDTITHNEANYYSDKRNSYDVSATRAFHPVFNDGAQPYTNRPDYFAPNGYGLYDMAGNVSAWCWDWFGAYASGTVTDPPGPEWGTRRVIRGGSWLSGASLARVASRYHEWDATGYDSSIGLRSVLPRGQP